jgi:hypothetical protein
MPQLNPVIRYRVKILVEIEKYWSDFDHLLAVCVRLLQQVFLCMGHVSLFFFFFFTSHSFSPWLNTTISPIFFFFFLFSLFFFLPLFIPFYSDLAPPKMPKEKKGERKEKEMKQVLERKS